MDIEAQLKKLVADVAEEDLRVCLLEALKVHMVEPSHEHIQSMSHNVAMFVAQTALLGLMAAKEREKAKDPLGINAELNPKKRF